MAQLSASVLDYVGRTVDILAFDDARASGEAKLTQDLVQPRQSGALTTGIQKLAQRFLIELLTERGSLEYLPARGTFFITQIRAGIIRTSQDLFVAFSAAERELRNNLRLEDNLENDPQDEQYQSATLTNASLFGDTAILNIDVTSAAGTTRKVIYPLRVASI
jgi:hypothetical protein